MSFSKALEKQKIRSKYLAYRDYLTYPERVEKSKKITVVVFSRRPFFLSVKLFFYNIFYCYC